MPSEPLDPCPVCGGPVLLFGDGTVEHGIAGLTAEQIVDLCCYGNKQADHRRLCAEVALARVVMQLRNEIKGLDWGALDAAIARVREASK